MQEETPVRRRRRAGTVGQAAEGLTIDPEQRSQAKAALRSAVKKFGRPGPTPDAAADSAPAPDADGEATAARRRADRAAQAVLGRLGRPPGDFDEAGLAGWLKQMSGDELKTLGRLVWAARQHQGDAKPGLDKVERQLSQQGVHLDINAQTVTVNLGTASAPPPAARDPRQTSDRNPRDNRDDKARDPRPPSARDWRPPPRRAFNSDWGRQWGRLKDFINGH